MDIKTICNEIRVYIMKKYQVSFTEAEYDPEKAYIKFKVKSKSYSKPNRDLALLCIENFFTTILRKFIIRKYNTVYVTEADVKQVYCLLRCEGKI